MAGTMTALQERRFFDALFGGVTLTIPATIYFGLFLTMPDDTGANGLEVSGNGYARVPIANVTTSFPGATTGTTPFITSKWNGVAITFPQDVTADWGNAIGLGAFDALSSGNMLWVADITPFRQVQVGDTAQIPATNLQMTLD